MAAGTSRKIPTSLEALRTNMTKRYGEGRVTQRKNIVRYDVIPTGSMTLDLAMRTGGWVRGRIHELVGVEGSSKTSLAIASMREAQKKYPDLAVGIIDMEQTFDFEWAEKLGLDTSDERFMHVFPNDSEDVSDQIKLMAETGLFSLIVVDSIGGMESKQAFEKDAGEQVMGRNAQVITRLVKHLSVLCRSQNVAVILINQFRANLNYGGGNQSAGPKALKYSTTTKVEMSKTSEMPLKIKLHGKEEIVAYQFRARVSRSKVAPQGQVAEYWFFIQDSPAGKVGIDVVDEALTIGIATDVIKRRGAWVDLPDGSKHNGQLAAKEYLRTNLETLQKIRDASVAALSHEVVEEMQIEFVESDSDEEGSED